MRKISTDALTSFAGDFVARGLGFVATAYLARTLTAEGFGIMGIGLSILSYGIWFADLGSSTIGMREMAKPVDQRHFTFGQILSVKVMLTVLVFVIAQLAVIILYHGTFQWQVSALFLMAMLPTTFVIEWYFQGKRNFVQVGISRLISGAVYVGLLLQFVKTADDVAFVPLAYAASLGLAAVWLILWRSGSYVESARLTFDMEHYRSLLKQTWSVGAGATFGQVVLFFPPIALGLLCSDRQAGLFVGAMKVVLIILVLDRVFSQVFLPAVSRSWVDRKARLNHALPIVYRALIVTSFAACTVVTVFARGIVTLALGPSFGDAGIILSILSWFAAGTLLNSYFAYSLIAAGHERLYMRSTMIGGIIAAVGIIVAAAVSDATAVAISVVAGEFVIAALMYKEFRKHFTVAIAYPTIVAAVLSAVFCTAMFVTNDLELWMAPVLLVAYIATAIVVRGCSIKDVRGLLTE